MIIQKNKKSKIVILLLIIILIAGGAILYFAIQRKQADSSIATNEVTQREERQKKLKEEEEKTSNNDNSITEQPSGEQDTSQPEQKTVFKPTVSSLYQTGDTVSVRVIVNGQSDGTCTVKLTSENGQTVERQAPVGLVTNYYACQGFDIEKTAFSIKGKWTAVVHFENATHAGDSDAKDIIIE